MIINQNRSNSLTRSLNSFYLLISSAVWEYGIHVRKCATSTFKSDHLTQQKRWETCSNEGCFNYMYSSCFGVSNSDYKFIQNTIWKVANDSNMKTAVCECWSSSSKWRIKRNKYKIHCHFEWILKRGHSLHIGKYQNKRAGWSNKKIPTHMIHTLYKNMIPCGLS